MNIESKDDSENSENPSNSGQDKNSPVTDQNSVETTINPSISKVTSETNSEKKLEPSKNSEPDKLQDVGLLRVQKFLQEKREVKNSKPFIKSSTEVQSAACEKDLVGDDLNKRDEISILCECEPNVSGAAVPTVISFTESHRLSLNENSANYSSGGSKNKCTTDSHLNKTFGDELLQKNNLVQRKNSKTGKKGEILNVNDSREKCIQDLNKTSKVPSKEQVSKENKVNLKRPSFIPKPTWSGAAYQKSGIVKSDIEKQQSIRQHRDDSKQELSKNSFKIDNNKAEIVKPQINRINTKSTIKRPEKPVDLENGTMRNTISSRMIGLQERLKATTSMLRNKIDMDKSKDALVQGNDDFADKNVNNANNISTIQETKVNDLYSSISQLKEIASALSTCNVGKGQKEYIEKLFLNIAEIKKIADKLCECENDYYNDELLNNVAGKRPAKLPSEEKEKVQKYYSKTKDNKIYIKFLPTKEQQEKKKRKETLSEQTEEVQTELALGSKLTSESLNSNSRLVDKEKEENIIKESDSLDGIFIPTIDPPSNIEEEDESNGLDITITFPEFNQLYNNESDSHLSVRLSDISEEALKKLKRCPKDFTLRMDFVQGKVLFQSGKGPANNFLIGPDLKFTENIVDNKKSDIISIKRSTECSYGSQLIPVENAVERNSYKSLKSTDSELFNVVNLPFLYKSPCVNATTKSCLTFKNDNFISMAIIARHFFKSMPQIPSLTNIFEDELNENLDTAFQIQEKKRKNRQNQKKRINSNTTI